MARARRSARGGSPGRDECTAGGPGDAGRCPLTVVTRQGAVMSDVKVKHEVELSRQEAARWLSQLAAALDGDGDVSLDLAGSTVKLSVPSRVRCEAEVEVDGDEVELELEFTWSTAVPAAVPEPARA